MVAAGMGSTIIPTFTLSACRNYPVRTDLLIDPEVTLGFYRISKRGRAKPELMSEFTDSLVSMMPCLINPDSVAFALPYSGP